MRNVARSGLKKHGQDSDDSNEDNSETKSKGQKKRRQGQASTGGRCKACGSFSHQCSNHSDRCFHKKWLKTGTSRDEDASETVMSFVLLKMPSQMQTALSKSRLLVF